jgi:hypothetical protein
MTIAKDTKQIERPSPASDAESGALHDDFGELPPTDPDLARVVEAWPTLPDPIRRAMMALLGSAIGQTR